MFTVNRADCDGCGLCVEVCPRRAIDLVEGRASIDQARCDGCGECLEACPTGAIIQQAIVVSPPRAVTPVPPDARWKALGAAGAVLAFVGTEVLPRLLPVVLDALERRAARGDRRAPLPSSQPAVYARPLRLERETRIERQPDERHRRRRAGPRGVCECPNCGYRLPHPAGVPCRALSCPHCGADLQRH